MAPIRGPQPLPGQERRLRLLAFVKQDSVVRVDKRIEDTAMTWPHLLVIEFIASMLFLAGLFVIGALVNAPLQDISNPDHTPNPSKAPWYFLNLQELLLHMNPALAGVIVPTLAIIGLMAIPYVDSSRVGVGTYFHSRKGRQIVIFSVVFTIAILGLLIAADAIMKASQIAPITFGLFGGVHLPGATKPGLYLPFFPQGYAAWADQNLPGGKSFIPDIIIPTGVMLFFPAVLVLLVKRVWHADRREWIMALFTGFITTYLLLTFVGTSMRGTGMDLFVPWNVPAPLP
jgi:quinol-cytochrome oxidoreductase complex cytochrome b subunit